MSNSNRVLTYFDLKEGMSVLWAGKRLYVRHTAIGNCLSHHCGSTPVSWLSVRATQAACAAGQVLTADDDLLY